MREKKMSSDIGKVVINPQATSSDKNEPISAFGEGELKVVAAQDLPMARVGSAGRVDGHIKTLTDFSISASISISENDINKLKEMNENLLSLMGELKTEQQSMILTAVNHIKFALQNEGASQTFMLGEAKKTLEKLDATLFTYESSPAVDNSSKMKTSRVQFPELLKSFIAFLAQILPFKEKPSVEGPKSEPESVILQEPVVAPPQVLSTSSPEFAARKKAIFDKLNSAINTLPTDLQDVSYHEATEARYEETYEALEKELDQLRDSYELGVKKDDDHPLAAEYNKLRTYGENIAARIAQLKNPRKQLLQKNLQKILNLRELRRKQGIRVFKRQSRS